MRRKHEKGEGRIGFIATLIVVGIAAFIGFKVIPVRIQAYEFRDILRDEARYAAVRKSDAAVKSRILEQAEAMELPLERKNLTVERTRREMVITATYVQPIDLKFTTYRYRFHAEERAPLF